MSKDKKKVLILGGGFGGVKTALTLSDCSEYEIELVSDHSDFRYYPALYLAATGRSRASSSIALSEIFNGKPVKHIKDTAVKVDREARRIQGASGKKYSYDILVISLGVITNYFGIKGLEEYSYGIKNVEEALKLRNHLHTQLTQDGKPDSNYIVIGGGPTGVELAGALTSYMKYIAKNHNIKPSIHVDLVEAAPRLLPRMPKPYSKAVEKRLRSIGVKLFLNQKVEAETADNLMINDHPLESHTVVWTAGVTNHPFLKANDFVMSDHGKAVVDEYLQAEPNIYVIGDNAETTYSGMAQTALYDGAYLAVHLKRLAHDNKLKPYAPKKPAYITPAGERWAAVLWGEFHTYGWLGWILRNAADFEGYKDLEPLIPAAARWKTMSDREESCSICFK
jgi:NADH dehydrogenase